RYEQPLCPLAACVGRACFSLVTAASVNTKTYRARTHRRAAVTWLISAREPTLKRGCRIDIRLSLHCHYLGSTPPVHSASFMGLLLNLSSWFTHSYCVCAPTRLR